MDVHIWINIIVLVVLVAMSAFFSSSETALTAVSRIRIETILKEEGPDARRAARVLKCIDDKHRMLSAILIGNNLVNILASAIATALAIEVWGSVGVGIATGILTFFILIFGEITPKSIATRDATKLSLRVAGIILTLMRVLSPLIFALDFVVKGIMAIIGTEGEESAMTSEEVKLAVAVSNEQGTIEDDEKEYIDNVFDFSDALVRAVMTPRIDMVVIKREAEIAEIREIYEDSRYTRYPVCGENAEDIVGILNMKDLLFFDEKVDFRMEDFIREPFYTFETKNTADLFDEMRTSSISMAIVLDEYGAVAGLVTLEDLLEELVGEIRDEYDDDEEDDVVKISENEYEVLGSANLEDISEDLELGFESEDYDTIGGYLTGLFDHFPKEGETFVTGDGVSLKVLGVENGRIIKILVRMGG